MYLFRLRYNLYLETVQKIYTNNKGMNSNNIIAQ